MISRTVAYEEQKGLLEELHQKQEADIHVATYSGLENDAGQLLSCCM